MRRGLVTIALVVAALAACRQKDESAAMQDRPRLNLPVVDDVQPFDEKDAIEVEVFRDPGAVGREAETRADNADLRAWQIKIGEAAYWIGKESLRQFARDLQTLGQARLSTPHSFSSGRALLIRVSTPDRQ